MCSFTRLLLSVKSQQIIKWQVNARRQLTLVVHWPWIRKMRTNRRRKIMFVTSKSSRDDLITFPFVLLVLAMSSRKMFKAIIKPSSNCCEIIINSRSSSLRANHFASRSVSSPSDDEHLFRNINNRQLFVWSWGSHEDVNSLFAQAFYCTKARRFATWSWRIHFRLFRGGRTGNVNRRPICINISLSLRNWSRMMNL